MRLEGKQAIVTGAASGIGRAIAVRFAAEGATVLAVDRDVQGGQATVAEIAKQGGHAAFVEADLTNAQAVQFVVQKASAFFGAANVLVNNAGMFRFGSVTECPLDLWNQIFAVNVTSAFLMCKYAIPEMAAAGGGAIVNIASVKGLQAMARAAAYSASKGALIQLTRSLAVDYGPQHIRANCVCPGAIVTPMFDYILDEVYPDKDHETGRRLHAEKRPLRMVGAPEDVAGAALYLASDDARYITGVCLTADGGWLA
jgi:NAD(P)-dependent dehydrogenase (short-subunit alcohol dehydrogenase family)